MALVVERHEESRIGYYAEMRRRTRAQFHYAVKMVKRNENIIRSTRMAAAIAQGDNRNLWREGRRMRGKGNRMPKIIDGI